MTPMRLRILAVAYWAVVAAMAAVYVTAPAIGPLWKRQLVPWYRAAADLAQGESGAGRIAARNARQAIMTREALPPSAAVKNGEWFERWNQDYLRYQRGELAKLKQQIKTDNEEQWFDIFEGFRTQQAGLINGIGMGFGEGEISFAVNDQTRLEINLDRLISPRETTRLRFGIAPKMATEISLCHSDNHVRVIWFAAGGEAPFSEEQSAIIPFGHGCNNNRGLEIDLSQRYDWLSIGQVNKFWILFRTGDNMTMFHTIEQDMDEQSQDKFPKPEIQNSRYF